jgi:hypothetical protein
MAQKVSRFISKQANFSSLHGWQCQKFCSKIWLARNIFTFNPELFSPSLVVTQVQDYSQSLSFPRVLKGMNQWFWKWSSYG